MKKLDKKDLKNLIKVRKGHINGLIQNTLLDEEFLQVTTFPKDSKGINLFLDSVNGTLVVNIHNLSLAHAYLTDSINVLKNDNQTVATWFKNQEMNKISAEIGNDVRLREYADIRSLEYIIGSNITKERMRVLKDNVEYLGVIGVLQRRELSKEKVKKLVR